MKNPVANNGFLSRLNPKTIEAVWQDHLIACQHCRKHCRKVEFTKTATLVHCCPEGAEYIKVMAQKAHAAP